MPFAFSGLLFVLGAALSKSKVWLEISFPSLRPLNPSPSSRALILSRLNKIKSKTNQQLLISPITALFPSPLEPVSETFIGESCFTRRSDHLKPNVSRYVGSWKNIISIISQRRTELNYQHGCVQTGAQLITLGWSPCCLCPRSARSQLTTWRFIAGAVRLPVAPKLSSSVLQFLTLSTPRGQK